MADTVSVQVTTAINGSVTKDAADAPSSPAGGRRRLHSEYNLTSQLGAATTPKATVEPVDLSFTLTGASKDWDLTAALLAADITETLDLTGKRMLALLLQFSSANNAAGATFGPQGANGYDLFGAGIVPTFYPGAHIALGHTGAALVTAAVGASDKDLRFAGTIGDIVKAILYFGEN